MSTPEGLTAQQILAMVVHNDDLAGFLSELAQRAVTEQAQHVGVTARGRHRSVAVAVSDDAVIPLDEQQYAVGVGPCLEALETGVAVHVHDMVTEARWGPYPAAAARAGVRSVLSCPLKGRDRVLGCLNLYSMTGADPREMQPHAELVAARAAPSLELATRIAEREQTIAHLEQAMKSRSVIDQALGIVMSRQHCAAAAAFALLTTNSQQRNRKVRDVAAGILASTGGTARTGPVGDPA